MNKFVLALFLLSMATSCLYRMPEEGEVHTIPTTNNSEVTRQSGKNWTPSVDY